LNAVYRMTGRKPKELEYSEPEETIEYLLAYFYQLKRGAPITYTELKNYCEMMSVDLSGWECSVIMSIDAIFENSINGL